jgi:hypothetical protein
MLLAEGCRAVHQFSWGCAAFAAECPSLDAAPAGVARVAGLRRRCLWARLRAFLANS